MPKYVDVPQTNSERAASHRLRERDRTRHIAIATAKLILKQRLDDEADVLVASLAKVSERPEISVDDRKLLEAASTALKAASRQATF